MAKLFKIHSSLTLDTKTFATSLKSASDRVTRFGRNLEKQTKRIGKSFKSAGKDLLFISAIPAALIAKSVKSYGDMADEVGKFSKELGISTEALTEYIHVTDLSGLVYEQWIDSIRKQQDALVSGRANPVLKILGLEQEALKEMSAETAFETLIQALSELESASERTSFAIDLWGKSGARMLRLSEGGAAAIQEMRVEAQKLGFSLSKEAAASAELFHDNVLRLQRTIGGFSIDLARILIPNLDKVVAKATEVVASFRDWSNENPKFASSLLKVSTGLTAFTVAAGASLFVIGQVAFGINSLIGLYGTLRVAQLINLANLGLLTAAVLKYRVALLSLAVTQRASLTTEDLFGGKITPRPGAKPRGVESEFVGRKNMGILRREEAERLAADEQKKLALAESQLKVAERSLKSQQESRALLEAMGFGLGTSKAQPGSIF